jgi:hypothetical protein
LESIERDRGRVLVTTGLAGCVDDAQASSGELYVKDALTDEVDAVHVECTAAEILPAEANASDASAWETVFEGNGSIELLSLVDSAAKEQLAGFEIEPGACDQLRLRTSNVTVEHPNGTEESIVVHGNVVTVAENVDFEPGEEKVLLDFDPEKGFDLARGECVPVVGDVQRSDESADGDGTPDFEATDDGDGTPDADDEDRDGDGHPDVAEQAQGYDKRGLKGVCTAWEHNDKGCENGTVEKSATALQWLQDAADSEGLSVEADCEQQTEPGAPDDISTVLPDHLPQKAREAIGDRHLGPPEDRGPGAGEDRREDERSRDGEDNQTREEQDAHRTDQRDDNQTRDDRNGNRTADRDQNQSRDGQPWTLTTPPVPSRRPGSSAGRGSRAPRCARKAQHPPRSTPSRSEISPTMAPQACSTPTAPLALALAVSLALAPSLVSPAALGQGEDPRSGASQQGARGTNPRPAGKTTAAPLIGRTGVGIAPKARRATAATSAVRPLRSARSPAGSPRGGRRTRFDPASPSTPVRDGPSSSDPT